MKVLPHHLRTHADLTANERNFLDWITVDTLSHAETKNLAILLEHVLAERIDGYQRQLVGDGYLVGTALCMEILKHDIGLPDLVVQNTKDWLHERSAHRYKEYLALYIKLTNTKLATIDQLAHARAGLPAPAAPPRLMATTKEQRYAELVRELKMRQDVYPGWISKGKIKKEQAAHRIACIEDSITDMLNRWPELAEEQQIKLKL